MGNPKETNQDYQSLKDMAKKFANEAPVLLDDFFENLLEINYKLREMYVTSSFDNVVKNCSEKINPLLQNKQLSDVDIKNIKEVFLAEWNDVLLKEGVFHHFRKNDPRGENIEETQLKQTILNFFQMLQQSLSVRDWMQTIIVALNTAMELLDTFVNEAESFEKANNFKLKVKLTKDLNEVQLAVENLFQDLDENINSQNKSFTRPTEKLNDKVKDLVKSCEEMQRDAASSMTALEDYKSERNKSINELEARRQKLLSRARTGMDKGIDAMQGINIAIMEYLAEVERCRAHEMQTAEDEQKKLRDFLLKNQVKHASFNDTAQYMLQEVAKRSTLIEELLIHPEKDPYLETIRDMIQRTALNINIMRQSVSENYNKLKDTDTEYLMALEKVKPLALNEILAEINYKIQDTPEYKNVVFQNIYKAIFSHVNIVQANCIEVYKRWEWNKAILENKIHNTYAQFEKDYHAQTEYFDRIDLFDRFDPKTIVKTDQIALLAIQNQLSILIDALEEFGIRLAAAAEESPIEHIKVRFTELKCLREKHNGNDIDYSVIFSKKIDYYQKLQLKLEAALSECSYQLDVSTSNFIYLNSLQIRAVQEKTNLLNEQHQLLTKEIEELKKEIGKCVEDDFSFRIEQSKALKKKISAHISELEKYSIYIEARADKLLKQEAEDIASENHQEWMRISKLSQEEKQALSDEKKIFYIHHELKNYSDHLYRSMDHHLAPDKVQLVESYLRITDDPRKSSALKLTELQTTFMQPEHLQLLKMKRDSAFISLLKKLASVVVPDRVLYRVHGNELIERVSPLFSLFGRGEPITKECENPQKMQNLSLN